MNSCKIVWNCPTKGLEFIERKYRGLGIEKVLKSKNTDSETVMLIITCIWWVTWVKRKSEKAKLQDEWEFCFREWPLGGWSGGKEGFKEGGWRSF